MSETITITVYGADELQDLFPNAYERAKREFTTDLWDSGWGNEAINNVLQMEADGPNGGPAVFDGRFLEWDLYRGHMAYVDGGLKNDEYLRLSEVLKEPRVLDDGLKLAFRDGQIVQHPDYMAEDGYDDLLLAINNYLTGLYRNMMEVAQIEERWLESDDYFLEHAEINEYRFDEHGRMRP